MLFRKGNSCQILDSTFIKAHSRRSLEDRTRYDDPEKASDYLKRGNIEALKNRAKNAISMLDDTVSAGSLKRVFALTADVRKQIETAENSYIMSCYVCSS